MREPGERFRLHTQEEIDEIVRDLIGEDLAPYRFGYWPTVVVVVGFLAAVWFLIWRLR